MGENPMMSEPNLNHTRHQMEQLEFLVAQDLFINESGAFADVFLPAASWAEKDGTFTNTDRRVQRVRQALAPRGQSRPDWQILCDLASRIETRLGRPAIGLLELRRTHPKSWRRWARSCRTMPASSTSGLEEEGLQTPVWDDQHPGTPYPVYRKLPARAGKIPSAGIPPVSRDAR